MTSLMFLPPVPAARCGTLFRTAGTYVRCRRDDGHEGRHHASGITWAAGRLPMLRYDPCTDGACCRWPEDLVPYLGVPARAQR